MANLGQTNGVSQVLAVLAGLVWSSLSIAWELDTSHLPKARMKMQLEELRLKLAKAGFERLVCFFAILLVKSGAK